MSECEAPPPPLPWKVLNLLLGAARELSLKKTKTKKKTKQKVSLQRRRCVVCVCCLSGRGQITSECCHLGQWQEGSTGVSSLVSSQSELSFFVLELQDDFKD